MDSRGSKCKQINIAVCAAFKQGFDILSCLIDCSDSIRVVATCHSDSSPFEKKIAKICQKREIDVLRKINVNNSNFIKKLKNKSIDMVILAWWPDIVRQEAINAAKIGWINLHPSFLPYGRGKHAYYWSIVENSPFGATIHFIDEGIDTGKILFQKKIPIGIEDTGESLYTKGVKGVIDLFKENCEKIINLQFKAKKQEETKATYHHSKEIEKHSEIILNKRYKARKLINILRARTFTNGPSAYFFHKGKKYFIRVAIERVKRQE